MPNESPEEGVIVEFVSIGKSVRVTAFDPVSMKEVVVVGSTKATRTELTQLALRKLRYMLNKDTEKS